MVRPLRAPAVRSWRLEELGLRYRQAPLKPWSDAADAETLARINPNARVPVLDDDGLILWESMAINLYLADSYGGAPFWPQHPRDRALVYQWSLWSQTEIDVRARHLARFSGDAALKRRAEAERLAALGDPRSCACRASVPSWRHLHGCRSQPCSHAERALGERSGRRRGGPR